MGAPDPTAARGVEALWVQISELVELRRCDGVEVARELDLPPSQLLALRHLDPDVPEPMGRLACALSCDKANVTGIVDRLEQRGLVERRADPADRRVRTLVLTVEGARVRAEAERRLCAPPDALRHLEEHELGGLSAALELVVRELREQRG